MNFIATLFEDVVAFILAILLVIGLFAYFGTSPSERFVCDVMTDNVVQKTACIMHTAFDGYPLT